jgi:hypothetical protein
LGGGIIYSFSQEKVGKCGKNKDEYKNATGLIIEKQTGKKQKGITHQSAVVNHAKNNHDQCKKSPKVKLRKDQRVLLIVRKQPY